MPLWRGFDAKKGIFRGEFFHVAASALEFHHTFLCIFSHSELQRNAQKVAVFKFHAGALVTVIEKDGDAFFFKGAVEFFRQFHLLFFFPIGHGDGHVVGAQVKGEVRSVLVPMVFQNSRQVAPELCTTATNFVKQV